MAKRAVIYARVSNPRLQDADNKVSIETQIADGEAHAAARGYIVIERFVENVPYRSRGKVVQPSGTRSDRPEYQRMLEGARAGAFDVIIAWKEDRLCRGVYAAVPLGRVLEETAVTVELVKESFDAAMFFIKAAIGKIEIDNIRDRMHMGVQGRLAQGRAWDQHKRYGYRLTETSQIEADPERAPWVVQIFSWALEGQSAHAIRRRLREADAPRPDRKSGPQDQSRPWPIATVHHILRAADYWQGYLEATRNGQTYRIACPALITRETFDAVQAIRRENTSHAETLCKSDYLCLGLITCADNRTWGARSVKWRTKGVPRKTLLGRYYCHGKASDPDVYDHSDCPKTVGSLKLDQYVWAQVCRLLEEPALVRAALDHEVQSLRASESEAQAELEQLQRDLDGLAGERQWVITQARKGRITDEDLDLQLGALSLQEAAMRRDLEDKAALGEYRRRAEGLVAFAETYLQDIAAKLETLNLPMGKGSETARRAVFQKKREIVKTLVRSVVMHKDRDPEIVFSFEVPAAVSSAYNQPPQTAP